VTKANLKLMNVFQNSYFCTTKSLKNLTHISKKYWKFKTLSKPSKSAARTILNICGFLTFRK
jgi:hypothetical protein